VKPASKRARLVLDACSGWDGWDGWCIAASPFAFRTRNRFFSESRPALQPVFLDLFETSSPKEASQPEHQRCTMSWPMLSTSSDPCRPRHQKIMRVEGEQAPETSTNQLSSRSIAFVGCGLTCTALHSPRLPCLSGNTTSPSPSFTRVLTGTSHQTKKQTNCRATERQAP
jgi:hypothetical protein